MTKISSHNDMKMSPLRASILTAVVTLLLSTLIFYFWSSKQPRSPSPTSKTQSCEDAKQTTKNLYTCGMHPWIISEEPGNCPICGMELTLKTTVNEESAADKGQGERKIAYWRAAMDPTEIYDAPGKSRMGMDLVPVYEDEVSGGVLVKIDPTTQQNMGIRTKQVEIGPLNRTIRTYGHITYDETKTYQYTPKFSGWIEKLYINYTGQAVKKGDKLFDIYSPELVTAQEEFLSAYRLSKKRNRSQLDDDDLLQSASRRLYFWDVPPDQIKSIKQNGTPRKTLTMISPYTGIVIKKGVDEGDYIKAGSTIFQISDLKHVWLEAHIFEYELPLIKLGQEAEMTLPYTPGAVYHGKVAYIFPYLEKHARDVVLRLEFDNPELVLKPDMYANVVIDTNLGKTGIIIPSEAVIHSGSRNLVFISAGNGKFKPRDVILGIPLNNGRVQVISGLAGNEIIVTSGQFLIDSESKLKEAVQKMLAIRQAKPKKPPSPPNDDDFFSDMSKEPSPEAGKPGVPPK